MDEEVARSEVDARGWVHRQPALAKLPFPASAVPLLDLAHRDRVVREVDFNDEPAMVASTGSLSAVSTKQKRNNRVIVMGNS